MGGEGVQLQPSFSRVSQLSGAAGEEVAIDRSLLGLPPHAPDKRLVGSLRLDSGRAYGCCAPPVRSDFRNPQQDYTGYFCREVRFELPIDAASSLLRLIPFGAGEVQTFELQPGGQRSSLNVTISNLCDDPQSDAAQADADFARYYDLLERYRGGHFVPHPCLQPGAEVPGLATGPIGCIPTRP